MIIAKRIYAVKDHRQAFEVFFSTRNYSEVQRQLGIKSYQTIFRWAEGDFPCSFNCPWHGWTTLIDEKERALTAQIALARGGHNNPIDTDKAIRRAIDDPEAPADPEVAVVLLSQMQRLGVWQHLFAKAFYDVSGLVIDFPLAKELESGLVLDKEDLLQQGLRITNFQSAVRCLQACESEMDSLIAALGLSGKTDTGDLPQKNQEITADTLRELRRLLQNTPKEHAQAALDEMLADKNAESVRC